MSDELTSKRHELPDEGAAEQQSEHGLRIAVRLATVYGVLALVLPVASLIVDVLVVIPSSQAAEIIQRQILRATGNVLDATSTGDVNKLMRAQNRWYADLEMQQEQFSEMDRRVRCWWWGTRVFLWVSLLFAILSVTHLVRAYRLRRKQEVASPLPRLLCVAAALSALLTNGIYGGNEIRIRAQARCALQLHGLIYERAYNHSQANGSWPQYLNAANDHKYQYAVAGEKEDDVTFETVVAYDAFPCHVSRTYPFTQGRNVLFGDGAVRFYSEEKFQSQLGNNPSWLPRSKW